MLMFVIVKGVVMVVFVVVQLAVIMRCHPVQRIVRHFKRSIAEHGERVERKYYGSNSFHNLYSRMLLLHCKGQETELD